MPGQDIYTIGIQHHRTFRSVQHRIHQRLRVPAASNARAYKAGILIPKPLRDLFHSKAAKTAISIPRQGKYHCRIQL